MDEKELSHAEKQPAKKKFDFMKMQDDLVKDEKETKKNLVIDDVADRQKRSEELCKSGKVAASVGKLSFMIRVNARYIAQGKQPPYTQKAIEALQAKLK